MSFCSPCLAKICALPRLLRCSSQAAVPCHYSLHQDAARPSNTPYGDVTLLAAAGSGTATARSLPRRAS